MPSGSAPTPPVGSTTAVDVGGRHLNVWRAGDEGAVVVLIHGLPTSHLLWHDVVPPVSARARVLAFDMLGYGWSERPRGWPVDIASQAAFVMRALDALDVERFVLVGHDLGAGVAQIIVTASAARVSGMVLANGVCFDAWPVPLVRAVRLASPVTRRLPPATMARVVGWMTRTLLVRRDTAAAFAARFAEPWRGPQSPEVFTEHLRALDSGYTRAVAPFLERVTVPVEVVWGRKDTQLKPRYAGMLADAFPNGRLQWVDHAGHFSPADAPGEVTAAVFRVLERVHPS